jgi:hypothetical protein|nr:hypothetical protein [Corynebacterium sp.]
MSFSDDLQQRSEFVAEVDDQEGEHAHQHDDTDDGDDLLEPGGDVRRLRLDDRADGPTRRNGDDADVPGVSSKSRTVIHTHRGMVAITRIGAMTVSTIDSGTLLLAR